MQTIAWIILIIISFGMGFCAGLLAASLAVISKQEKLYMPGESEKWDK